VDIPEDTNLQNRQSIHSPNSKRRSWFLGKKPSSKPEGGNQKSKERNSIAERAQAIWDAKPEHPDHNRTPSTTSVITNQQPSLHIEPLASTVTDRRDTVASTTSRSSLSTLQTSSSSVGRNGRLSLSFLSTFHVPLVQQIFFSAKLVKICHGTQISTVAIDEITQHPCRLTSISLSSWSKKLKGRLNARVLNVTDNEEYVAVAWYTVRSDGGREGDIAIHDGRTGERRTNLPLERIDIDKIKYAGFTQDGSALIILYSDGWFKKYSCATGRLVDFIFHAFAGQAKTVREGVYSGKLFMVILCRDKYLRMVEHEGMTQTPIPLILDCEWHRQAMNTMVISSCRTKLAYITKKMEVRRVDLRNLTSSEVRLKDLPVPFNSFGTDAESQCRISENGRFVSLSEPRRGIMVLDMESKECIQLLDKHIDVSILLGDAFLLTTRSEEFQKKDMTAVEVRMVTFRSETEPSSAMGQLDSPQPGSISNFGSLF
jgi:hypothetical protein